MSDPLAKMIATLSPEKKAKLASLLRIGREPIAVLGLSCRFPGGSDGPDAFWRLLESGTDGVKEVPADRWPIDEYYHPDPQAPGKMYTRWAGFLDEVDKFDAGFFGISPREAARMDPQQRIFLEVAWEALEDAGQSLDTLSGSPVGVFTGVCANDYCAIQFGDLDALDAYVATGNAHSIVANRLSYLLDFVGPSVAVDTACSSSLVAVHLACQSLHAGDCSTAVVGGVHLILTPHGHIIFSKAQMMAPDGRCKAFDARADGFARGEGCGVVVLRRLSDALAANDPIRAVILGSAVNQDGRSNGLMAPSGLSQQEVIRRAHQQANVDPEQIEYIEAHGTGTSLGDPIEIEALAEVFGPPRPDGSTCAIGAVKTNIGHLEAAAGIAGLIKAVLSLEREVIPPNLHFKSLNPNIALERMPFAIPTSPIPWPSNGRPRYVGVSSFGFGGTNAHALLGAASARERLTGSQEPRRLHMLALSARAPDSLRELATAYRDYLTSSPPAIGDVCYTAAVRRTHHKHRIAVLGRTHDDLAARIDAYLAGRSDVEVAHGGDAVGRGLVFVYSGQGGQWAKMGHRLALDESVFRTALERCAATFAPLVPWSLLDELATPEERSRLDRTDVAQPTLFALQVALTELWRSWGMQPDAVVGHSLGEVTAAYVAGALTLDEAAQIIVHRALLMQRTLDRGKMIAVELSGDEAARVVAGVNSRVRLAAVNGPQSVVLSGEADAVNEVEASLRNGGVVCRPLRARYAFHSPLMDALREEFEDSVRGLAPQETLVPLYSTVSGGRVDGRSLDRKHWADNMCQPVQFAPAIVALQEQDYHAFLEVGPHAELSGAIARISDSNGGKARVFASLRRGDDERSTMLRATAGLYAASLRPDFSAIYPAGVCVPLPRYPWRRERHWQQPEGDPARLIASTMRGKAGHPLLGNRVRAAVPEVIFQAMLRATAPSFLNEHRLHGRVIVPAVAFLEMVLAAAASSFGVGPVQIEDVLLQEPLIIPDEGGKITQLTLVPDGSKEHASFRIFSLSPDDESYGGAWRLHVSGAVRKAAVDERHHEPIDAVVARLTEVPAETFYEVLESLGFSYGPRFKAITGLWCGNGEAIGRIELDEQLDGDNAWAFHPCLLEGCLQTVGGLAADAYVTGDDVYIPIALERFRFYGDTVGRRLWSHARLRDADAAHGETVGCDVTLLEDGRVAGRIEGLILKRASREALQRRARTATNDWLYEVEWREQPPPEPIGSEGPRQAWLVFADEDGFGADVCARLTAAGCATVMVTRGSAFRAPSSGRFEVDPADVAAMREALAAADAELSRGVDRVLYLWGLDARLDANSLGAELVGAQETGCRPALNLVQALAGANAARQPRLWLVTRGAQAVNGSLDARGLAQSPLWGLGAAAALEHPDLWGGMIDLDPHGEPDAETLATALMADDGEDRSALRNGQRWVPRLVQLESRRLLSEHIQPDPNACYLITGGLGGLGLEVARGLAERGARHLVLMSRHHRPEAQSAIDEIRRLGVVVDVVLGDVAVAHDVTRMLVEIATGHAPLRGVVHAAGVLDDGVLTRQSWNRFATVFAPKLSGAWELHRQTRTLSLDFFVLFSSAAGILGSPGQANYAAANVFLDALAHLRRRQGLPATAIDWGPWANVGMAASTTAAAGAQLRSQALRIDPDEGVRLMVQLVAGGLTQAAVLPVDRPQLIGLWPTAIVPPLLAAIKPKEVASTSTASIDAKMLAKLRATPPAERADVLASFIRAQIIEILGADPADPPDLSRGLFDMGMDSLMALELKNRLQNVIGQTIPPTLVLEHPTIEDLSTYLIDEFFDARSDASTPDDDQIAETIARIDSMSPEELAAAVNPAVLNELSKLSDEEVDRRLAELLQRKGRR
jgi:acyl transferase domain-containing protein/NAD(P)-dependent dehydrogenase (short-subunit alcohol dehydrogenase family)/acyl carrier protein